ncbi:tRNA (uridine(54)-C5)-methyltransferase TrmA [Idiomarina sp. OT37-5b]|jgi:tRNA (uracil-5-)-methyltransferase|uniref:tRNA/tmRNA (uracil-C(5))-methyltransferase n=1 Tax=Idiomarina aquatica TaxID=1327752 RepID=A0AA94EDE6_9GAMM|nr:MULTISPECIES: tRNA (uridine(54)-C5)-methyltransferase TrmA [Idiomarina]AVJ56914.1 tRNA (uridine(54)-C5)-methyltransferase TrmA [Idiomarina sp. OT37-5b]RUO40162.1 tRNA (uridine(54)-C5)-methyltransferase TrmA [Idiomarina aquatica]
MTHKAIGELDYQQQLNAKRDSMRQQYRKVGVTDFEVFPSAPVHYRMRAEFRLWHEGDDLYYIMFNPETREKVRMDQFLPGSELINRLMQAVRDYVIDKPLLRRKLFQVDFLTTTTQQAIVSVLYHRPLDDEWQAAAAGLHQHLQSYADVVHLIGRARKQKVVFGEESVTERVTVNGRDYQSIQTENSFTQPNAGINQQMIEWVSRHAGNAQHDLLELYCGNGNFTLPLAQQFRQVLATEISKSSVHAAREGARLNEIDNVTVVRMSAEDFSQAMQGKLASKRAADAQLERFNCQTVLVDPPRAGLDQLALELVAQYSRIIYISCNPETLIENIEALGEQFEVTAAAIFDQFPYTDHIEAGVIIEKKS